MKGMPSILIEPPIPDSLGPSAQWLAGEGAGSWFVISPHLTEFLVHRYSPTGVLECEGVFLTKDRFQLEATFEVTYPSHCAKVSVLQNGKLFTLNRLSE